MPNAANITVKNGAASPVDKTFTLIAPAAGDGSYANWRLKEGLVGTVFPRFAIQTRSNGSARKANIKLQIPSSYTESSTQLTKAGATFDVNIDVTVPDEFPEALKNDAVAFTVNLLGSTIVRDVLRDAVPAV